MLTWALSFLAAAILAAVFGFGGLAASVADAAKSLCFLFLVLSAVAFFLILSSYERGAR